MWDSLVQNGIGCSRITASMMTSSLGENNRCALDIRRQEAEQPLIPTSLDVNAPLS